MQDSPGAATADRTGSAASAAAWLTLAAHAPTGLAATAGAEHRLEFANPAFARLTGSSVDSLTGRKIRDVIRTPALTQQLDSVRETGEPLMGLSIHTDDGRTCCLAVWPRADTLETGGVVVQLSAAKDVPFETGTGPDDLLQHHDEAAQELQQHSDELREINARLVRSALREEQFAERERAASRAKSEFLALVSHELRTPLTAVIGYADMLQTGLGGLNDKGVLWADRIRSSAWHLREIVDDLIGTISENRAADAIVPEATTAGTVAREAIAMIETAAGEKGVEVRLDIPQDAIPLRSDRRKLRQILTNLLSNAVKFTEHGSIDLSVARGGHQGEHVVFRVSDSGIGIADGDIERIFEPFVQVDSSTTRRFGGCGLGLGLSRRFARALGGDLTVTSELGRGSTFVLTTPAIIDSGPRSVSRSDA